MAHIVKRRGHKEKFDERKVYASCYAAGMSCQIDHPKAEALCEKVTRDMKQWIKNKKEVSANEIFVQMAKTIAKYNKHVAYMYETHLDVS